LKLKDNQNKLRNIDGPTWPQSNACRNWIAKHRRRDYVRFGAFRNELTEASPIASVEFRLRYMFNMLTTRVKAGPTWRSPDPARTTGSLAWGSGHFEESSDCNNIFRSWTAKRSDMLRHDRKLEA
jgi:hypothetical protein